MPAEIVTVRINGNAIAVPVGSTVCGAILLSGRQTFRRSVSGEARGPLCGMGICFECRVTINGMPHCRSCQIPCEEGMDVRTDE